MHCSPAARVDESIFMVGHRMKIAERAVLCLSCRAVRGFRFRQRSKISWFSIFSETVEDFPLLPSL